MKINPINYLYKITLGGSKESSKRFIAVFTVLVPMDYIVFRFTNLGNMPSVLGMLIGFVLSLLVAAAIEKSKESKIKEEEPKEPTDDNQQG
jgi:hypothetical protein